MKRASRTFIIGVCLTALSLVLVCIFLVQSRQRREQRASLEEMLTEVRKQGLAFCYQNDFPRFPHHISYIVTAGQIDQRKAQLWSDRIQLQSHICTTDPGTAPVAWASFDGKVLVITLDGRIQLITETELSARRSKYIARDDG